MTKLTPPSRPEYVLEQSIERDFGVVEKPLTLWERAYGHSGLRKSALLMLLALIWEIYARILDNSLLVPTFTETIEAFFAAIASGELPGKALNSLRLLVQGYVLGLVIALAFTTLAILTKLGNDLLESLTAMFNPLPAIALLPLALIWFGLGAKSIIFVLVHSVLWAVALNTHSGFKSVSNTMRMVGRNYGLGNLGFIVQILIGWAFAWRTLIAAELVFGASSGQGGLGWFIFESKNQLDIPNVFAGLFTVILIGLTVENLVFRVIEVRTIKKWGMQA